MPIYPPRTEPVKKQEELEKRKKELISAIKKNITAEKLIIFLDKYRQAKLSLFKAKIHQTKEGKSQKEETKIKVKKLETLIQDWINKSNDEIIKEVMK